MDTAANRARSVAVAVAQIEGTRPILTGINISIRNGILQFVGIDGYRLAIRRQKINIDKDIEFIVSGRAVNEVVKLIDENVNEVNIIVGQRLVSFEVGGYMFISRLLEGEFVNYEKLIPAEYKQLAIMNSSEIINTVERVSLLINDTFSTPLRCVFEPDNVIISCATSMGRAKELYRLKLDGEPFEIGLNSRYLLDALKACDQGNVLFRFNGSNAGVTIISADEGNNDFLYLIMPMRLK